MYSENVPIGNFLCLYKIRNREREENYMITVLIDELTPCLRDVETGEIIETEVVQIVRKSFLQKYNKKNGWYTNWAKLVDDNLIYALVIKGTCDIQGLVAIQYPTEMDSAYVTWMCAAPQNNKLICDNPKYMGVGGHLFAIASQWSLESGYDGVITGFAANENLLSHYQKAFGAIKLGILHQYHLMIDEINSSKIREVYDYEWTDEKI